MAAPELNQPPSLARLPRWFVGTAVGLTLFHAALVLVFGRGTVFPPIVWYVPMMHSFVTLAALSVAFVAFGRYRALREPAPFWLGVAFVGFSVFSAFYVLSWPGLLPDGRGVLSDSLNTTSWFWHLAFSTLAALMLVALFARWPRAGAPGEARWAWVVVAILVAFTVISALVLAFESTLPVLALGGVFTPTTLIWNVVIMAGFVAGAVFSVRRYRATGDSLFGYVSLVGLVLAFAVLTSIIGGRYYDLWWYWQRVLWVVGFSVMLFGLLSEYVLLYERERSRTRELVETQSEVLRERNRLRVLIDTAPVGIVFRAAPTGQVVLFNRSAENILGRSVEQDAGISREVAYYDLALPTGEPFLETDLPSACALSGRTCLGIEMVVRHPSGRRVYVLANSAPLFDAAGAVSGAVVALQEITPLKEQELLREEFLSAAAHELKTPVTTIKGYAQILRGWTVVAGESREAEAVAAINSQCDRLNRRVQELLQVAQVRAGAPAAGRSRFDLGEAAVGVVAAVAPGASRHRLSIEQEQSLPVVANRESIEEVLGSLVENAIKYSPAGGEIAVHLTRQNGRAVVSVSDRGVGIARERQAHIFEPFYETVPAGKPGYRGVIGLSLYLSKLAVERSGGSIWLESEPGQGATFFVSLPLA